MDIFDNSRLTIDERILLESLEETETHKALNELDNLLMYIPIDEESYDIAISLRDKLSNGHINIEQELKNLPDDDERIGKDYE